MFHSPAPSSSSSAPLLSRTRSPSPLSTQEPKHAPAHDDQHVLFDDQPDLEARSPTSSLSSHEEDSKYDADSRPGSKHHHTIRSSSSPFRTLVRRPRLLAIVGILVFLVLFGAFSVVHVSRGDARTKTMPEASVVPDTSVDGDEEKTSLYSPQVIGAPTESFWDNIRDDTQYITAWINAGWTNDFMTYANLLYLAILTNRTAILPPFAPSHVGSSAGYVNVGDVFDLPRLSSAIGVPIIQWSDLKLLPASSSSPPSTHVDQLGCWSIWATVDPNTDPEHERRPRGNVIEPFLNLDVSYTPIPNSAIMLPRPQFAHDPHTRFFSLAALTFPDGRARARLPASAPFKGRHTGFEGLPDERVACFDFPYYVASEAIFEYWYDWSPAWRFVGTHAHWTPWLRNLAIDAIRQTFGLQQSEGGEEEEIPPFIALHIRHGDFGRYCPHESSESASEDCFAPLNTFAARVDEVKAELKLKKGIEVERVLVTSDESDPAWWEEVRELGWEWVDHERLGTEEKFGKWYTVFIDAVVQSLGAGFVGTDKSTMSLIAQRRVEDWNAGAGATREVKWGRV